MIKIHHQMGRQQQAVTAAAKWTGERRKRTLGRNGDVTQLGGSKSIKQLLCVEGGGATPMTQVGGERDCVLVWNRQKVAREREDQRVRESTGCWRRHYNEELETIARPFYGLRLYWPTPYIHATATTLFLPTTSPSCCFFLFFFSFTPFFLRR